MSVRVATASTKQSTAEDTQFFQPISTSTLSDTGTPGLSTGLQACITHRSDLAKWHMINKLQHQQLLLLPLPFPSALCHSFV